MLKHILLGLLRDGEARHGYDLVGRYHRATGLAIAPGSVYRELAGLERSSRVVRGEKAAGDERRIRYVITDRGRQTFDRWLQAPADGDHPARIAFLGLLSPSDRTRYFDRWRNALAVRGLQLTEAFEAAHFAGSEAGPRLPLLEHRLRLVAAERELVDAVQCTLEAAAVGPDRSAGTASKVRRLAVG